MRKKTAVYRMLLNELYHRDDLKRGVKVEDDLLARPVSQRAGVGVSTDKIVHRINAIMTEMGKFAADTNKHLYGKYSKVIEFTRGRRDPLDPYVIPGLVTYPEWRVGWVKKKIYKKK